MIYTLQQWPDVLTTVIRLYTDSQCVVLMKSPHYFVLCLSDRSIILPCQNAFSQFDSQPSSIRGGSDLIDYYKYIVVDLSSFIIKLSTAEPAQLIIADTVDNKSFTQQKLAYCQQHVDWMTRSWMNSVMEYLPLGQTCSLHLIESQLAQ